MKDLSEEITTFLNFFKDICQAVNFALLDSVSCVAKLNLSNATIGWYAMAIQVEDFKTTNVNYAMSRLVNLNLI